MNISVPPQAMSSADEATFTAPEGIFSLSDEVKPPVLHTSAANAPNLHPSRLTTITVTFPAKQTSQGFAALLRRHKDGPEDKDKELDKDKEADKRDEKESEETSLSDTDNPESEGETGNGEGAQLAAGLFSPTSPPAGKKKTNARATHNIRSTSSSFITRIHTVEGLNKHLSSKQGDTTFVFYNGAKSFFWYELGGNIKEPLARVTFSAFPTCHDINRTTSTYDNLDLLIGFNTGDIMWFDPLASRYVRINKQGSMTLSPVTCVRWVPGHKSMFLASHADGTIMVYDKEREDGQFKELLSGETPDITQSEPSLSIEEKVSSWNPLEEMLVTRPPQPITPVTGSKNEKPAKNPVSHWKICRRALTDFHFSPDTKYLAASSEDGCLRIIDSRAEKLVDTYSSYFGSLTCLAWTPDSRYVLTGGQDDLISIISLREQRVVARCQGHTSFVVSVALDHVQSDARVYRFGSVGEDKQLALWDFTVPPNRARTQTVTRSQSTTPLTFATRTNEKQPSGTDQSNSRYHPAQPRSTVPIIYPSMLTPIDGDIPSNLSFAPSCLITATRPGFIKTWTRPTPREIDMTAAQNALFGRSPDVNKDVTTLA